MFFLFFTKLILNYFSDKSDQKYDKIFLSKKE